MKMQKRSAPLSALLLLLLLAGCGGAAETAAAKTAPAAESAVPETRGGVAGAEDMAAVLDVAEAGMVPVCAASLKDGVYPVEMRSSSAMFRVDHCTLEVAGGQMRAVLYMTGDAYLYMYPGPAASAAAAAEAELVPLEENADGSRSFTLPVAALDAEIECAAFSRRKELWYDRTLLFRADSLPAAAFAEGVLTTAESLALADGVYTAEVSLSGGSGRASVSSPALLTVTEGQCAAVIEWGSANYDYMRIGEERYLPINEGGNSAFIVPVAVFDRPITVFADTTAMSQPHEIEYALIFSSASVQAAV